MGVTRILILRLIVTTSLLALPGSVHPQLSWQKPLTSLNQTDCHFVNVIGAVRVPSRFELKRPTRLRELIDLAGGLEANVGKNIHVMHTGMDPICAAAEVANQESKSEMLESFDPAKVVGGEEKANPFMKPGDVVVVAGPDVVYVTGDVKTPKAFILSNGLTLKQAILLAGGPTKNSKRVRVRLLERTLAAEQSQLKLVLNLKEIVNHRVEDPLLQAYDIIEVSDEEGWFGHGDPIKLDDRIIGPKLPVRVVS